MVDIVLDIVDMLTFFLDIVGMLTFFLDIVNMLTFSWTLLTFVLAIVDMLTYVLEKYFPQNFQAPLARDEQSIEEIPQINLGREITGKIYTQF